MVEDVFGAGKIGAATAKGLADVQIQQVEAEIQRRVQSELTKRAQINASKDIVKIQQKEFTKRHKTVGENVNTWINQSDETLNALDRVFYSCRWRKGRKEHHLRMSAMSLFALGPLMQEIGLQHNVPVLQNAGVQYRNWTDVLVDHAKELARNANAGDLNFALPAEVPGLIDTGSFYGPSALTAAEIQEMINASTGGSLDQTLPDLPGTGPGQAELDKYGPRDVDEWVEKSKPTPAKSKTQTRDIQRLQEWINENLGSQVKVRDAIREFDIPSNKLFKMSPEGQKHYNKLKRGLAKLVKEHTEMSTALTGLQKQTMEDVKGAKSR